jgi:biopolymer transport protein ExbD
MSTAFARRQRKLKLKSEINVVPYIDVMLVLLIIFMVTVPMVNYANTVGIAPSPPDPKHLKMPEPLRVHVGAGDTLSLDGQPVSMAQLQERFAAAARLGQVNGVIDPMRQPAVELAVEPDAEYALVARVMSRAKNADLQRIGFAK